MNIVRSWCCCLETKSFDEGDLHFFEAPVQVGTEHPTISGTRAVVLMFQPDHPRACIGAYQIISVVNPQLHDCVRAASHVMATLA